MFMETMFIINACRPSRKSSKNTSSGGNVGRHLLCRGVVKAGCVVPQILMCFNRRGLICTICPCMASSPTLSAKNVTQGSW